VQDHFNNISDALSAQFDNVKDNPSETCKIKRSVETLKHLMSDLKATLQQLPVEKSDVAEFLNPLHEVIKNITEKAFVFQPSKSDANRAFNAKLLAASSSKKECESIAIPPTVRDSIEAIKENSYGPQHAIQQFTAGAIQSAGIGTVASLATSLAVVALKALVRDVSTTTCFSTPSFTCVHEAFTSLPVVMTAFTTGLLASLYVGAGLYDEYIEDKQRAEDTVIYNRKVAVEELTNTYNGIADYLNETGKSEMARQINANLPVVRKMLKNTGLVNPQEVLGCLDVVIKDYTV